MCEKAEEIQKKAKFEKGDFVYSYSESYVQVDENTKKAQRVGQGVFILDLIVNSIEKKELAVWLPRQDQLQEISKKDFDLNGQITELINCQNYYYSFKRILFETFEKLWLAYIMKQLYNKEWNGKEWLIITK